MQSLRAAARDGVDVRLLVPGATDIWILRGLSRAGYPSAARGGGAGLRVEWHDAAGPTAVADGRWARVGSTNLNLQSWIGNWELDVAVEDEGFAGEMESMYLDDLGRATEITLTARARVVKRAEAPRRPARQPGSAGRAGRGGGRRCRKRGRRGDDPGVARSGRPRPGSWARRGSCFSCWASSRWSGRGSSRCHSA